MKNLLKISTLLLLLTAFASCDLDRYPDTGIPEDQAMTNPSEAQQIVFGVYSAFKNSDLQSGSLALGPDIQSDLVYAIKGYGNSYGDLYRWDTKSTDPYITKVYKGLYTVITRCNFFTDRIGALEEEFTSSEDKASLRKCKGDIYFMRALAYSDLIRLYCKAYDPATAETELGVSLVTTYKKSGKKPLRATLADSYKQVLEDLEMAEKLIIRVGYGSPYITVGAVNALYARVYLHMQNWEKAEEYATKTIEDENLALQNANYNTYDSKINDYEYLWTYDDGPEVIWKIKMSNTDRGGSLGVPFLGEKLPMREYLPDYIPAQWLLDLYGDNDLRYQAFFTQIKTSFAHGLTWPLLTKYPGNPNIDDGGQPLLTNMPKVFRLSEQYLIRSEARYRLGNQTGANEDLTTLRRARIKGYGSSSASGDKLLTEIQNERVKELCMEGFRLSDLKRWGKGFQRTPQAHTVDGPNELRVQAANPLFTWPIPKHEMDAVPGMQPNESND